MKEQYSLEGQKEPLFQPRESLFTEWRESQDSKNFRSIYKFVTIIFIYLVVRFLFVEFYWRKNQNVIEYLEMIWNGFGGFQLAVAFLIVILICALLVYPGLRLWIWTRDYPISVIIFLTIYVLYQLMQLIGFTYSIMLSDIGIYLKFILGVLLVFQMMKIHSFVRSNATKNSKDAPKVQAFLYFLQTPTLIYCDEYPRTEKIRWAFVLRSALESVAYLAFKCFY